MLVNHLSVDTTKPLNNVQMACCNQWAAVPSGRSDIWIFNLNDLHAQPLTLAGHHNPVTCLRFSDYNINENSNTVNEDSVLVSAASDYLILWKVDHIKHAFAIPERKITIKGSILSKIGVVNHMTINNDSSLVATCVGNDILVFSAESKKQIAVFEGHTLHVNCAEFVPAFSRTLVSVSADRTFKVWGVQSQTMLYTYCILSSSPLISICMHAFDNKFSIASKDGMIRFYLMTDSGEYICIHNLDLNRTSITPNIENRLESYEQFNKLKNKESELAIDPIIEPVVLFMYNFTVLLSYKGETSFARASLSSDENDTNLPELINDLRNVKTCFVIGLADRLMILNAMTFDLISVHHYKDANNSGIKSCVLSVIRNLVISQCADDDEKVGTTPIWLFYYTMFKHSQLWILVNKHDGKGLCLLSLNVEFNDEINSLSVVSMEPLSNNSILKCQLNPKEVAKNFNSGHIKSVNKFGGLDKRGLIIDKLPLTFQNKITSSGYNAKRIEQNVPVAVTRHSLPTQIKSSLLISDVHAAINNVHIFCKHPMGACSDSNGVITFFKNPKGKTPIIEKSYPAFRAQINKLHLSHISTMAIICSDKTTQLHSATSDAPLLTIKSLHGNFEKDNLKQKSVFTQPLTHCQFYYVDKFIIIASGNETILYSYYIDNIKTDLKRNATNSRYKLIKSFKMPEFHSISAFSAANSFYSYIGLCCGSNKSITVLDFNAASIAAKTLNAHERIIHSIEQHMEPSQEFASNHHYNLFLTSAAGDCIKLWDLRTKQSVRSFRGHKNQIHSCKAIFYSDNSIATGSEDRSVYIFDVRTQGIASRILGFPDVVLGMSSLHNKLYATTSNGFLMNTEDGDK